MIPLLSWDVYKMQEYALSLPIEDIRWLENLAAERDWNHNWNFEEKLIRQKKTILVTDSKQHIVFASSSLYDMTGYTPAEVLGRSPRMFQGPETSPAIRAGIRSAVEQQEPFTATLLNYRKGQQPYNCHIEGFPVFNQNGELMNYIAFETSEA